MTDYNRPLEQILNYYQKFVKPAFEEFCLPTKKYADVIIPRGVENLVAINLIVQHINDYLNMSLQNNPNLNNSATDYDSTDSESRTSKPVDEKTQPVITNPLSVSVASHQSSGSSLHSQLSSPGGTPSKRSNEKRPH
jgi:hypothetical protein